MYLSLIEKSVGSSIKPHLTGTDESRTQGSTNWIIPTYGNTPLFLKVAKREKYNVNMHICLINAHCQLKNREGLNFWTQRSPTVLNPLSCQQTTQLIGWQIHYFLEPTLKVIYPTKYISKNREMIQIKLKNQHCKYTQHFSSSSSCPPPICMYTLPFLDYYGTFYFTHMYPTHPITCLFAWVIKV